jgi:uroporphyrinogen-III synthase
MDIDTQTLVITRPSGQAKQLIESLNTALIKSDLPKTHLPKIISLPLLEIIPRNDSVLTQQILKALKDANLAIFVSPNAIECVMRLLNDSWQSAASQVLPVGVMGAGSQFALQNHGIGLEAIPTPMYMPQDPRHSDSEGLWKTLQHLNWEWPSKKVIIFKGEGGRDWLSKTLKDAGANINLIDVYSRIPLSAEDASWKQVSAIDLTRSMWLLTSSEAVHHLGKVMQEEFGRALTTAVAICSHINIAHAAKEIGFGKIVQTDAGDDALIKAVLKQLQT